MKSDLKKNEKKKKKKKGCPISQKNRCPISEKVTENPIAPDMEE